MCDIDILKFDPFESDLENAIKDSTAYKLMNCSYNVQDCVTITTNTKFILVSWDVARPGLWYDIEVFGTRSQFKTMERTWPQGLWRGEGITKYTTISYDNFQNVGLKDLARIEREKTKTGQVCSTETDRLTDSCICVRINVKKWVNEN